jgi:hypothetical protein
MQLTSDIYYKVANQRNKLILQQSATVLLARGARPSQCSQRCSPRPSACCQVVEGEHMLIVLRFHTHSRTIAIAGSHQICRCLVRCNGHVNPVDGILLWTSSGKSPLAWYNETPYWPFLAPDPEECPQLRLCSGESMWQTLQSLFHVKPWLRSCNKAIESWLACRRPEFLSTACRIMLASVV